MTASAAVLPRSIRQPGPPAAERIVAVESRGTAFAIRLSAGENLLAGVNREFAAHGFIGGVVELADLTLRPMAYVMPALSTTPEHAAFYSAVFRPVGGTWVKRGAMTVGRRDGAPFFHAHACWVENESIERGGHILPDETIVGEPVELNAFGFSGGCFEATIDQETNFKLFEPRPDDKDAAASMPSSSAHPRAFAVRVRPNQDLASALEGFCAAQGVARGRIWGGVGSTIGARFEHGPSVENFATEVYIAGGTIAPGPDGAPHARLPVGLVDFTGAVAEGVLRRGDNPVLMTFELVIEEL